MDPTDAATMQYNRRRVKTKDEQMNNIVTEATLDEQDIFALNKIDSLAYHQRSWQIEKL